MSEFDDIRPYHDEEIRPVLKKIIADDELIDLLGGMRFKKIYRSFSWCLRPLVRWQLGKMTRHVNSVSDFQNVVAKYLIKMIETTMDDLVVEGLGDLDINTPRLFMSNHRDITLDPALTNYALYLAGSKTLRIAIGDNLLTKPFASDLMRLNKSFIVRRSISQPRKLLAELKRLSRYIWHSLQNEQQHIWIAHREGRAKNGWDKTDVAIIKMLAIAKPKEVTLSDYIATLNIVPVAISYEFDPCDALKARELKVVQQGETYVKDEHEDLRSIGLGISGYKGRVDLVFGKPLSGHFETADDVALALDQAIVSQYRLQTSNLVAYKQLYGEEAWDIARRTISARESEQSLPADSAQDEERAWKALEQRISGLDATERELLLTMYANPINHKLKVLGAAGQ